MKLLRKHTVKGSQYANRTAKVLQQRGLEPVFSDWVLIAKDDAVILFGDLNVRKVARVEQYTDPKLLHHLSTICDGTRVLVSNTNGLRYAYILAHKVAIPTRVEFPGIERGVVRLGIDTKGKEVRTTWVELGHQIVCGQTGMGKSWYLRLIVYQAIGEGVMLYLSDIDGRTFPMLANHPALATPIASTPEEAHGVVAKALAEIDRRAILFDTCDGCPEDLYEYNSLTHKEKLPIVLTMLDEYNSTAMALGGAKGGFSNDVAALTWRGRKFGVNVIVAAQDFEKAIVGRMRDQADAICFRVKSHALTRLVDCVGATSIPKTRKGRVISSRWGMFQTYLIDKSDLVGGTPSVLTPAEIDMILWAQTENDGYLPLSEIKSRLDISQRKARALAADWDRRAWLMKDASSNNARRVTETLAEMAVFCTNRQTVQTVQTPVTNAQTVGGITGEQWTNAQTVPTNAQTVTNQQTPPTNLATELRQILGV